jgi:hypothetical protein
MVTNATHPEMPYSQMGQVANFAQFTFPRTPLK